MGWVLALSSTRGANSRWKHESKKPANLQKCWIDLPNLVCAWVQAVPLTTSGWRFYFQPGGTGTGGATSPTTLKYTQPKVDQPKSLLSWGKPLKSKLKCENKQRVAPLRQSGSRLICGWPPVVRSASWKRKKKPRLRLFGARSKRREAHRATSKRPPRKLNRIETRMRSCQCISHFAYELRSRPLVHDRGRVRGQMDRVRSLQIRIRRSEHGPHTVGRAGYPFPEVNLPQQVNWALRISACLSVLFAPSDHDQRFCAVQLALQLICRTLDSKRKKLCSKQSELLRCSAHFLAFRLSFPPSRRPALRKPRLTTRSTSRWSRSSQPQTSNNDEPPSRMEPCP